MSSSTSTSSDTTAVESPFTQSSGEFVTLTQSEHVSVVVGQEDEQETFRLPRTSLEHRCPWFKAALNKKNGFVEAQNKAVKMPENTPAAFRVIIFWVYLNNLPHASANAPSSGSGRSILTDYLEAYLLAQYILMPDLQNEIMTKMCQIVVKNSTPSAQPTRFVKDIDVKLAYDSHTTELEHFILDAVYMNLDRRPPNVTDIEDLLPSYGQDREFVMDFYRTCWERERKTRVTGIEALGTDGRELRNWRLIVETEPPELI